MEAVSAILFLLAPGISNDALVADLSHDRWRVRNLATFRLMLRGLGALPACERGERSDDAEVAHRCRDVRFGSPYKASEAWARSLRRAGVPRRTVEGRMLMAVSSNREEWP